eukprot:jgi/Botrbrau1/19221/Bobra.0077s0121.1
MGGRGMEGSLSVQMDRLKRTMQNRDKRRDQERRQRMRNAEADGADPYAKPRGWEPSNATGGVRLGPAAAATAAIALADALEGPELMHCHLCQVSFRREAEMQQHVEGPIHRKAVARLEKRRQEEEARGAMSGVAEAALAAAAWANDGKLGSGRVDGTAAAAAGGGPGSGRGGGPSGGTVSLAAPFQWGQAGKDGGRGRGRGGRAGEGGEEGRGRGRGIKPPPPPPERTHQDVLAEMRRTAEPLNIGGWVPPSINLPRPGPSPVGPDARQAPTDSRDATGSAVEPAPNLSEGLAPVPQAPEETASGDEDGDPRVMDGGGLAMLLGYGAGDGSSEEDGEETGSSSESEGGQDLTELTSFF